jgi:hypothetical protein
METARLCGVASALSRWSDCCGGYQKREGVALFGCSLNNRYDYRVLPQSAVPSTEAAALSRDLPYAKPTLLLFPGIALSRCAHHFRESRLSPTKTTAAFIAKIVAHRRISLPIHGPDIS